MSAAPHYDNIKNKIIKAASDLLQEKTFNEISLSQIAKSAGVTKGSVYYYYKSKDEILYDIADGYLQTLYDDLISWVENEEKDTSMPRLLRYILLRGVDDPGKALRLHLTVDAISGNEFIKKKILNRYLSFRTVIEEKIAERKDPEDSEAWYESWLILTVIDGLLIQKLLENSDMDIEKFIDRFVAERV